MKKILMASAALLTMVASASAADLYAKAPARVAPVSNWTGFYAGVNAGFGGGESTIGEETPFGGFAAALKSNGFLGGGQIGYNWQVGQLVYGLEADIQGTDVKSNLDLGGLVAGTKVDYFGTVRGRIGFMPWERSVVYATGGLAYGQTTSTFSGFPLPSNTKVGWTAGAGLEYMIAPNWSVKTEYLYVDLGKDDFDISGLAALGPIPAGFSINEKTNMHVVRAGVNYHF